MRSIILSLLFLMIIACNGLSAYTIKIEKQSTDNSWIIVNEYNEPFIIKGICYSPTPVGKTIWEYNMFEDSNTPWLTDGEYMEKMGVNTIRIYGLGEEEVCQSFLRQMYKMYSIYTIFPLPLKMEGADFSSDSYKERIKAEILKTVETYKDTPGILVWLLGNEIDYFFYDDKAAWGNKEIYDEQSNYKRAKMRAEIVFRFVSDVAAEIKKIDNNHPVGVSLGFPTFFPMIPETVSNIDFVGLNYYQGRNFSSVWSLIKKIDKPIIITEFGYDAFNSKTGKENYNDQALFIVNLWKDIYKNTFLSGSKAVSLGGCIFEWTDEWWKNSYDDPNEHNNNGTWPNSAWLDFSETEPNNVQEEYFGIMKVLPSREGVDKRFPREVYFHLKKMWNSEIK